MDSLYERIFASGFDRLTDLVDAVLDRHKESKLKPWPQGPKGAIDTAPVGIAESSANWRSYSQS